MTTLPISSADTAKTGASGRRLFLPILLVMTALTILTLLLANAFWLQIFTSGLISSIAIAGVSLLYGRLGLISLNQYALVGIGGWIALRVNYASGLPFEVSMVCGGVGAAVFGTLWGLPALRVRGLYLALVTLMLAGAFQVFIIAIGFPDGGAGFFGKVDNNSLRVMMSRPALGTSDRAFFVYVSVVAVVALILIQIHLHTRPGRAWALVKRDDRMAQTVGVNVVLYKSWAFFLAGFLAGISGALLAALAGQLDGSSFVASNSMMLFAISIVAGTGNWLGSILAGILLKVPPALFSNWGVNSFLTQTLLGILLIQALIAGPQGISGDLAKLFETVRNRLLSRRSQS